jgi:hypothetical protein
LCLSSIALLHPVYRDDRHLLAHATASLTSQSHGSVTFARFLKQLGRVEKCHKSWRSVESDHEIVRISAEFREIVVANTAGAFDRKNKVIRVQ